MKDYPVRTSQQLGAVLQGYRMEQELTQREIASRAGMVQSAISQIESDPSGSSLARVFRVLAALDLEVVVRQRSQPTVEEQW